MAAFTFDNIVNEIQDIQEEGVEFVDKQLVWDTADDGEKESRETV